MPKSIGCWYLKRLGRNPQFLTEAVTYTTFPAVRRYLREAGFECNRVRENREALNASSKRSPKWKVLKIVAVVNKSWAVGILNAHDFARRLFKTTVYELVQKPQP